MSAVITANNPAGRDNIAPAPALHEDGTNYRYRMFFDGGQRIADSDFLVDLIELLAPGYERLDNEEDRYNVRTRIAEHVRMLARAQILADLDPEDAKEIKDWEWAVLNYGADNEQLGADADPYGWGDGSGELGVNDPDQVDIWFSKVPLVLLESSYAPFTDVAAPLSAEGDYSEYVSNIIWLRHQNDEDLLRSLSRIGYITFGRPAPVERDAKDAL